MELTFTGNKSGKPIIVPGTFNDTGSWRDYVSHFEVCARINGLSIKEMGLYLSASLRGTAQEVLENMDGRDRMEFYCLASAMKQQFDPENQEEMFRAELKGRVRKSKESIAELAQEIRRLDPEMCWKIFQSCMLILDDAVRTALELEAFQKAESQRGVKKYI